MAARVHHQVRLVDQQLASGVEPGLRGAFAKRWKFCPSSRLMLGTYGPCQDTANTAPDGATNSRMTVPVGVRSSCTVNEGRPATCRLARKCPESTLTEASGSPSAAQPGAAGPCGQQQATCQAESETNGFLLQGHLHYRTGIILTVRCTAKQL